MHLLERFCMDVTQIPYRSDLDQAALDNFEKKTVLSFVDSIENASEDR
jgi:hypothetical protein